MSTDVVRNFVFFQRLWLSCVVGAGIDGLNWLALTSLVSLRLLTWLTKTRVVAFVVTSTALCIGLIIDNLRLTGANDTTVYSTEIS